MTLLKVENLHTHFKVENGIARAVDGVTFSVSAGESVAIVGESGCGKSVTAMSIMRLIRPPRGYHPFGKVILENLNLLDVPENKLQHIRGKEIAMIFQEPMTALNPLFTIGNQLREPLVKHLGMDSRTADKRCCELLERMGISHFDVVMKSYPHQLSGGIRQRVMIAMAMACKPKLLIADEPTTALDVTIQAQILGLIRDLQNETGMGLLLITHSLGVVNQVADNVVVMYSGRVAESGNRNEILNKPKHPYTEKLLECIPQDGNREKELPVIVGMVRLATDFVENCRFAERCPHRTALCESETPPLFTKDGTQVACFLHHPTNPIQRTAETTTSLKYSQVSTSNGNILSVENLTTHFPIRAGFFNKTVNHVMALNDVSLKIPAGLTLAVVGESGCGKSTLGQSMLRLISEARGKTLFNDQDIFKMHGKKLRSMRKYLQIIFQDPFASLNPRMNVHDIVSEGLRVHNSNLSSADITKSVHDTLLEVGLNPAAAVRYPHEFSGGQRQRIAIARALILKPKFMVLDEATSALDVSVQAQILNLLRELQSKYGLTYLFITHDIGVVSYISHEIAVMYLGKIVEYGLTQDVLSNPKHPYTKGLLAAVPRIHERRELPPPLIGDVPRPIDPPSGCHFHPRCPLRSSNLLSAWAELCPKEYPSQTSSGGQRWVRCHAADEQNP